MGPNELHKRVKKGDLEFLILSPETRQEWLSEAQSYLERKGYWYTINQTAAEQEEKTNVAANSPTDSYKIEWSD